MNIPDVALELEWMEAEIIQNCRQMLPEAKKALLDLSCEYVELFPVKQPRRLKLVPTSKVRS